MGADRINQGLTLGMGRRARLVEEAERRSRDAKAAIIEAAEAERRLWDFDRTNGGSER